MKPSVAQGPSTYIDTRTSSSLQVACLWSCEPLEAVSYCASWDEGAVSCPADPRWQGIAVLVSQ